MMDIGPSPTPQDPAPHKTLARPIDGDAALDRIDAANAALKRIKTIGDDWLIVGEVYMSGRHAAMSEARTNVPKGKRYNHCLDAWAVRVQFDLYRIAENTRTALAHIMDNRPAFDVWRAALSTNQRQDWNHPRTLWRRFDSTRLAKTSRREVMSGKPARPSLADENARLKTDLARARAELDSPNSISLTRGDSAKDIAAVLIGGGFTDSKLETIARLMLGEVRRRRSMG